MRFFACVLLAAAAAAGCAETAAPTIPSDAGRDASIDPDSGPDLDGSVDGAVDGGIEDGGVDGGLPDGGGSWCETSPLCPSCPDPEAICDESDPCSAGEVCLSTGCEDFSRCFVIGGGACETDEDCADPAYACNTTVGRCLRTDSGCDDSNDCVAGFACEDGVCVDRRVPCATGADCPHGYTCFFASPDQRFCRRVTRACADDIDCLVLGVPCGDADGDGSDECMPSLTPNQPDAVSCDNTQCSEPSAPVCEIAEQGTVAACGRFGLCGAAVQCALGFECRDLWGDGRKECVSGPGSCVDSSACAPREVCASPRSGGPPTCVGGPST
ncbi:MAG: hypothetical protein WBM48_08630 [Polyangiales bacterium]|jgi:hypothetical protein